MEYIYDYGLFLAQAVTLVAAILLVIGVAVSLGQKQRHEHEGQIEIRHINEKYKRIGHSLRDVIEDSDGVKADLKAEKKAEKAEAKARKKQRKSGDEDEAQRPRLFVIDFDGDMKASAADNLREEISAILPRATDADEILVRLESPGGLVHSYGFASSQLQRVTDAGVTLTVAVDKVAASGGYMMACVADRIVAAPFAVIGSIGVLAQLPNFHRLLKKHDIDFEQFTAGEYKRTVTLFGENTDKGRDKFQSELEDTHVLFKEFVAANRPELDVASVATGEVWYGQRALDVGLVDELKTSDALVQESLEDREVYEVRYAHKKNWQERLGMAAEAALERTFMRLLQEGRRLLP
ncbi:MAG: protease SohB [Pseudomonadota bacterium]